MADKTVEIIWNYLVDKNRKLVMNVVCKDNLGNTISASFKTAELRPNLYAKGEDFLERKVGSHSIRICEDERETRLLLL